MTTKQPRKKSKSSKKTRTPAFAKKMRFAEEYVCDLNATRAAQRAGYSKRTAYSAGWRLLKDVEVQVAIAELKAKRSAKVEENGLLPLEFLLSTMRTPEPVHQPNESPIAFMARYKAWQTDRLEAAKAAAPYVHNRLSAVEHSTKDGKPMVMKIIAEIVKGGAPT